MRFELTVAFTTPPFQDGALNRSANAPCSCYSGHFYNFTDFQIKVNSFFSINILEEKKLISQLCLFIWGGRWGSNPRMTGPQPAVLTTSPHPPCVKRVILYPIPIGL